MFISFPREVSSMSEVSFEVTALSRIDIIFTIASLVEYCEFPNKDEEISDRLIIDLQSRAVGTVIDNFRFEARKGTTRNCEQVRKK